MGLADRIERKLEATVGDAFARVFGGSIVPQEVEARLRREAQAGARDVGGGRILAPNDYVITLSESDYRKVSADPDRTSTTFAKHLEGYIHDQGWQTYGDVVVRFEQSSNLHTGQFRARGLVNPDTTTGEPAQAQQDRAYTAEPGVPPMSDNPSYRGGQGPGRPADDEYDDRYGRPDDPRGQYPPADQGGYPPRGGYPEQPGGGYPEQQGGYPEQQGGYPDQGGYPPRGGYPDQGGYPEQGGYPDQGGYPPSYEQRPPAGYGPPPGGGYDQGYRQPPPGYGPPGGQPGYGAPPAGEYDYGRPPGGRPDDYGRPGHPDQGGYPDQGGGYPDQGYGDQGYGGQPYGRPDYGQQPGQGDYGAGGYGDAGGYGAGYGDPGRGDYDYAGAGYGQDAGYGRQDYQQPPATGRPTTVTLQLDDGSGRTYQLREGANVIGRGQDAQFRLPDTGVSRRHLEIRWDGQVALLSDLNSTNGTTVNNAPVQEWQLADGDVIRLGHSEIIVRMH
ncbi:FhaA domain-containing protein [Mycolicibacterium thermoresistibile]|uniref:FHA domain-containing protein n=2 Tax=Mycolicibacterium thermoresistibile TaxID=1797 RepID=G7CIR4_MYCT3|nr:FhaA domain-containing protein [Mycolicibacterium thermoresistibile]EHI11393.1 FHA domain-containing protein [Mycolicibacterium thermoresistibile ATCC 19527]GAT14123.1 FHA domain-containing protein [Mycolicibacterium thermoresistibile]